MMNIIYRLIEWFNNVAMLNLDETVFVEISRLV